MEINEDTMCTQEQVDTCWEYLVIPSFMGGGAVRIDFIYWGVYVKSD
jgi:hypothetical protein